MITSQEVNTIDDIPEKEVLVALESILANNLFIKAPRARRLLRFLVEKTLSGSVRDINEYAIGIDVFDRSPSNYTTTDDPIVRVQIGRLREKLKTYYAIPGQNAGIEISIPVGSYIVDIKRINRVSVDFKRSSLLAIRPFKYISSYEEGGFLALGLHEELKHQLFKAFGKIVVWCSTPPVENTVSEANPAYAAEVNHLLEGSVQIDGFRIRASIRLVDVSVGCIIWSEQFDRYVFSAITHQEELATSICLALKSHFGYV